MIKLAIAVGFLAVFGLVAWALVVLLSDKFKSKETNQPKSKEDEN